MIKNEICIICDDEEYDKEHILELISKANTLFDYVKVNVIAIGKINNVKFNNLFNFGVDIITICVLDEYDIIMKCEIVCEMLKNIKPAIVFFPSTDAGKKWQQ